MKKFYDKLVLLLAALVLIGGVALYFAESGKVASISAPTQVKPADNTYLPVPVPHAPETSAQWPQPTEQSSTWIYDVFTPPKIYLDANGQFTSEPILPPPPPEPFGVYLVGITRDLYRIQLQGYIEEDRKDAAKNLVLLFDQERNATIRLRIGETNETSQVELSNFEINRMINAEQGEVEVEAKATVRDLRTDAEVVLVEGEVLYETGVKATLASVEDPSFRMEFSEEGVSFENAIGKYTLLSINLEANSVTVEKMGSDESEEAKTMTLEAGAMPRAETTPTPARANPRNETPAAEFDFPF